MLLTNLSIGQTITYVSPKKDTLILPNNEVGILIKTIWDKEHEKKTPVILFADETTINKKNYFLKRSLKKQTLTNK